VQRERADPPSADLLLDRAARPHEDRGSARLVDRHLVAGDLCAFGPPQLQ
jgi:hypothetical protein